MARRMGMALRPDPMGLHARENGRANAVTGDGYRIVEGYQPGAIGRMTQLHADYYIQHWGFGVYFEAKVARELAAFFTRSREDADHAWFVVGGGDIWGSLVIDGGAAGSDGEGARLRWFMLGAPCRGIGLGEALMSRAVGFRDRLGYRRIYLNTFEGLEAARALYEKHGFRLAGESEDETWGVPIREQRFERITR